MAVFLCVSKELLSIQGECDLLKTVDFMALEKEMPQITQMLAHGDVIICEGNPKERVGLHMYHSHRHAAAKMS